MIESERMQCRLLAFLLDYPDTVWREELPSLAELIPAVAEGRRRHLLQGFVDYVENTSPMELQEAYTAAFDLDPATSLHLTYHLMGDTEDRGKVLAGLSWIYHREGLNAEVGELPDYLPMILEFLALCPKAEDAALLHSCLGTVATLAKRLEERQHPYAVLLEMASDICGDRLGLPTR